jgi:hypothetical protein
VRSPNVRNQVAGVSLEKEHVAPRGGDVVHDQVQEVLHQLLQVLDVAEGPVGLIQDLESLVGLRFLVVRQAGQEFLYTHFLRGIGECQRVVALRFDVDRDVHIQGSVGLVDRLGRRLHDDADVGDDQLVSGAEAFFLDPPAVEVGAVGALVVLDVVGAVFRRDLAVETRDGGMLQRDRILGIAADVERQLRLVERDGSTLR